MNTSKTTMLCALDAPLAGNVAWSGGKSAGLYKLISAGLPVPPGFVVTTAAFDAVIAHDAGFQEALKRLQTCVEGAALRDGAEAVRKAILACTLADAFARDLVEAWKTITKSSPVAVRSSATAEDLAGASFAGQQDTYLSIDTEEGVLRALRGCWASLFTERAVVYRRKHGFDHTRVSMAVVIQQMVQADAAGVLFTADPVSGHRAMMVIEAVKGLGEALVSGHATPERYRIRSRDGVVLERIGSNGAPLGPNEGLLDGRELNELRSLGAQAQNHARGPVDIEWATKGNRLWLLQARPITTLWPMPEGEPLPGWRVFLSFGHVQVNTAALSRVGISMFQRMVPLGRDNKTGLSRLILNAGERLYIDVTPALSKQPFRTILPPAVNNASEPIADRLRVATKRPEIDELPEQERASLSKLAPIALRSLRRAVRIMRNDPLRERDRYVDHLDEGYRKQHERLAQAKTLGDRFDVLHDELGEQFAWMFSEMFPRLAPALGMAKLVTRLVPWLDSDVDHRLLLQGLEGNITTEMDLALADLADLARDVPALVSALKEPDPRASLEALRKDLTCAPFFRGWDAFLARFGHRSAGEIDPEVPRWREDPRIPLRSVAGALDRPRGALREQHRQLMTKAMECRDKLVAAAREKPFGSLLAPLTAGMIDRMRAFQGVREQHKFIIVKTVDAVRSLALEAGEILARAGALSSSNDIWFLDLGEIREALRELQANRTPALQARVAERRSLREKYAHMSPPAVMTSEGEAISVIAIREVPKNSLAGTAVSGGTYEGTARVVHDPAAEELGAGEVLVARFTDPGWTPLFGHAGALVMEVGGQMTHGSVIAREIGIPAVVAVEGATTRIKSGDRIRVDGERGWVTLLEGGAS